MNKVFIFVACGAAEHIKTLHFSIKALRKVSKYQIIVLTDSTRNEITIEHHNIIDIKTPEQYNHHQASIFLKTGLHKFLPKGNLYCYLDTDVVAIDEFVDNIFEQKNGIISFATDHCKIQKFSPHAVNCSCLKNNQILRHELEKIFLKYYSQFEIKDPLLIDKQKQLIKKFDFLKKQRFNYFLIVLRFLFTINKFKLDDDTYFLRWKKIWVDKNGDAILFTKQKKILALIEKETSWRWNRTKNKWISPEGYDTDNIVCDHLTEYIYDKFNIKVENPNWQHWNGGVFLFDDKSHDFLKSWHLKTLCIFEDKRWKTRDQGTLIATAWEFGLQDVKNLPIEFNFLADYHHPTLIYLNDFTFRFSNKLDKIKPHFLHIYHEWGNVEWALWRDVEKYVHS